MTDALVRLDLGQFLFDDPTYIEDAYEATLRAIPPYIGAWEPSDEFLSILHGVTRYNMRDLNIIRAGQVVLWQEAYIVPLHETLFTHPFMTLRLPPTWNLYPSDALRHAFFKQEAADGKLYRAYAKQFRSEKQQFRGEKHQQRSPHQTPIIDLTNYIKTTDSSSVGQKEP